MSNRLTKYNPKDIIATLTIDNAAAALIAGLIPQAGYVIDGWADGTFFDIAFPANLFTTTPPGADGEQTRTLNPEGFNSNITFTLKQASRSNLILSTLLNADLLSNLPFALQVKDLREVLPSYLCQGCFITQFATGGFASSADTNRVWSLFSKHTNVLIQGYES